MSVTHEGTGRRVHMLGTMMLLLSLPNPSREARPTLDIEGKYVGYFENRHGEQWVFIGDRIAQTAELRGGDIGWDRVEELTCDKPMPNLVLENAERLWLRCCWAELARLPIPGDD